MAPTVIQTTILNKRVLSRVEDTLFLKTIVKIKIRMLPVILIVCVQIRKQILGRNIRVELLDPDKDRPAIIFSIREVLQTFSSLRH